MEERDNLKPVNKKTSAGLILTVMLISMMAGAVCMNKVSPVLINIVNDFDLTTGQSGILISIFSLAGIFLSIPMGMLITKYGSFKTGLISLVAIIAGSSMGAIASSYSILLVSRGIEGIGLLFLATIGPAAVANAFSDEKRGTAMGLLMCYMSFGQILALNLAPIMASVSSWRSFWWLNAGIGAAGLVLWIFAARNLDSVGHSSSESKSASAQNAESTESASGALGAVLKNKAVWLICIPFLAFCIAHFGAFNYLPTYMVQIGGISSTAAGSLVSIASLIGIPVGIIGGVIADKCGSRKKTLAATLVLLGVVIALFPLFNASNYIVLVILYGLVSMAEAGLSFTSITEVVKSQQGATASAVLNTAQWIGAFMATTIFGMLLSAVGWNASFYCMAGVAVLGGIVVIFNKALR
ncbi:MAG: MFS transporter [Eubacteriaceae bacterium]|jgi:predicted MFS family arabinose efflux permease|nr:MFS transporter [Eubacteriaceae bacterium]